MNKTPIFSKRGEKTMLRRHENVKSGEYFNIDLHGRGRGHRGDFLPKRALDFVVFYVLLCIHINLLFASARF
jgi:hypothetical protein